MSLLRLPLLHFFVLGAVAFAIKLAWLQPAHEEMADLPVLRVADHQFAGALNDFRDRFRRSATPEEERLIYEMLVDQEILLDYAIAIKLHRQPVVMERLANVVGFTKTQGGRESVTRQDLENAIAADLHRNDLVIRRMMIDGAQRVIRAVVLTRTPDRERMAAFLDENAAEFATPPRVRLTQLLANNLKHQEQTGAFAEALLVQASAVAYDEATTLGDKVHVATDLPPMADKDLERKFGAAFVDRLKTAPVGEWFGPVASPYGQHVIFIHERIPSQVPPLEQIEDQVRGRLLQALADEWLALRMEQLRESYRIIPPSRLTCADC